MPRNDSSRRDAELVSAAKEMERLLKEAGKAARVAAAEYDITPRWCGRSPPDPSSGEIELPYPWNYWLTRKMEDDDEALKHPDDWVVDEVSGTRYHQAIMELLAARLEAGLPPVRYDVPSGGSETPRRYLDRIRGLLRWEHRLDSESLTTKTFALLRVRKGRSEIRSDMAGKEIRVQTYEYVALPQADIDMHPAVIAFSEALHRSFKHADRFLMPRSPTDSQLEFLHWVFNRGGQVRVSELIAWIDADPKRGSSGKGQGTEAKLLRHFCEKDAPRGSRVAWRLRAAAYDLIAATNPN
jgi:hypothetical protein